DGQIGIGHTALKGRTLSAGLPAIHLKDIGKDNGGASPAEVIDKVMASIGGAAAKVAGADLDKALGTLRDTAAGAIKDAVKDAAPGATDQLQRLFKQ
ncbi:MAG: hypothetical protein HY057_07755, partial [Rhodospirillales bacterium]|nr:hypothetical protein [Rhodospirillales bacterium]